MAHLRTPPRSPVLMVSLPHEGRYWSFSCRCNRQSECSRGQGPERWLWSFQSELGCLQVAAMSPANISREERREVSEQGRLIPHGEDSGDGSRPRILMSDALNATSPCTSCLSWGLAFSVSNPGWRALVKAWGLVATVPAHIRCPGNVSPGPLPGGSSSMSWPLLEGFPVSA